MRVDLPGGHHVLVVECGDPSVDAVSLDWGCVQVAPPSGRPSPVPPFDMMDAPSLDDLPPIPGASVSVQYTLTDAPFGQEIDYHQVIVDGRIATLEPGWIAEADLYIEFPYVNYLRLRLGRMELLDALVGGDFKGDIAKASLLGGILEAPEYQEAWSANAEVIEALLDAMTAEGPNPLTDPATLHREA